MVRWSKRYGTRRPIRRFLYQSPIDWLARLLQRPGVEELVDIPKTQKPHTSLSDVWHGSFVRELKGSDGRWFFRSTGRYLFALNIDGFNPNGRREAKKKKSVCGIYMALLNLPIHLRYRPQNICFVRIIPGPHEPLVKDQQLNHFLRLIVDDLMVLYKPGVHLSSTWKYPNGRTVQAALGLLLNDLRSARPVGGFVSSDHTIMCSVCEALKSDLLQSDWNFSLRDKEQHREHRIAWRDAGSQADRTKLEQEHGVRWTELMRLPYYDGPRMNVPEAMHGLKNAITAHCQDYWGMSTKYPDDFRLGLPVLESGERWPNTHAYRVAENTISAGKNHEVDGLSKRVAEALLHARGYRTGGLSLNEMRAKMHEWVSSQKCCWSIDD